MFALFPISSFFMLLLYRIQRASPQFPKCCKGTLGLLFSHFSNFFPFSVLKAIENAGTRFIKGTENYENLVREELKKTAFKSFVASVSTGKILQHP